MFKKYALVIGIFLSVLLLIIASLYYPGGSQFDKNAIGYSWRHNYISNLFGETAVNGAQNPGRFWAIGGMFFMSLSLSYFFIDFSKRIPTKGAASVVKYLGIMGMICTFMIATPWHDVMVSVAATLFLVCLFYITIFVFKSKLHLFKILCFLYLLLFYFIMYIYGARQMIEYLPVLQKVLFLFTIILTIALHLYTAKEDFLPASKQTDR